MHFQLEDATFDVRGAPWLQDVETPFLRRTCELCASEDIISNGTGIVAKARFDRRKGSYWPDFLGSGLVELKVYSPRARASLQPFLPEKSFGHLSIVGAMPKRLERLKMPEYAWLDWPSIEELPIDVEACGFVDASVCPQCGRLSYSISETYDRRRTTHRAIVPRPGVEPRQGLFRLQHYGSALFCTEQVRSALIAAKLRNIAFRPLATGHDVTTGERYA
jgi:hypothetical protein